jgi:thiosulfate/3-mercaptopyruvate sulfurtransferase
MRLRLGGLVVAAFLVAPLQAPAAAGDDAFISVTDAAALHKTAKVRFVFADSEKDFEKGHVPGSVDAFAHDLHYLDDVRKCKGLPMCQATAFQLIGGDLGIDPDTEVVVYDAGTGVNASGTWFFLKLYGHPKVRIMDGGLATWSARGLPVEKGAIPAKIAPRKYTGRVDWDMIANRGEVEAATRQADKYLIVDARHNLDEYTGKTLQSALKSPGKEVSVARGGFIPTAVFSPWSKYAGNKGSEADKPTLKDAPALEKQLAKLEKNGYKPDKTIISYCMVGLGRGTFQYLALKKAGHAKTKVYVGSWNEWGNTAALPVGKTE